MGRPKGPLPVEKLAAALQECMDEAVRNGARKASEELSPRFSRRDAHLDRRDAVFARLDAAVARKNEALRMLWIQCGGDPGKRLPIDEQRFDLSLK